MRILVANEKYDFDQVLFSFNKEKSSINYFIDDKQFKESTSLDLTNSKVNTSTLFNKLDEEFSTDFLKTKEKILDQITEKKEEPLPEPIQESIVEDQIYDIEQIQQKEEKETEDRVAQSIIEDTKEILKTRKKSMNFEEFTKKFKERNEKIVVSDIFYNALCMAQNREINIHQKRSFENSSIVLKLNK